VQPSSSLRDVVALCTRKMCGPEDAHPGCPSRSGMRAAAETRPPALGMMLCGCWTTQPSSLMSHRHRILPCLLLPLASCTSASPGHAVLHPTSLMCVPQCLLLLRHTQIHIWDLRSGTQLLHMPSAWALHCGTTCYEFSLILKAFHRSPQGTRRARTEMN